MKRNLYLVGAGGLGREMEFWINLFPQDKRDYEICGYIDDNPGALFNNPSDYAVVGDTFNFEYKAGDLAALCITNSVIKEEVYNRLKEKVEIFTFVSPLARISKFSKIGKGTIITPNCLITTNVTIGECVLINLGSQVGHDSTIGDFSSLMTNVDIGGNCKVGRHVFFGSNSTLIPEKRVNNNIRVGAGSVVINNLNKPGTYFGNPAKQLSS
jgi:sugar O-acyltransferase (sialic acid O-acetyltransferase NeuD family)